MRVSIVTFNIWCNPWGVSPSEVLPYILRYIRYSNMLDIVFVVNEMIDRQV